MLSFPFAIDGISLYYSNCTLETNGICYIYRKSYLTKATAINGGFMIAMVALIFVSMYYSRKVISKTSVSIQAKTEHRLIHQALFSTVLLFIAFGLKLASALTPDFNTLMFFSYLSNIVTHFHHLAVMFSHFWLSPSFKIAVLKFYHLKFLIPKKSNGVTKIVAVAISRNFQRRISSTK
uniref:Uncharacterized protein n=1 Tax=Panagrolaimus davidi TaxID=227884 RepID=A0A914PSR7_9BILA